MLSEGYAQLSIMERFDGAPGAPTRVQLDPEKIEILSVAALSPTAVQDCEM